MHKFNYASNIKVQGIISFIIICFILLNNISYQTKFQFDQIAFCFSLFFLFSILMLANKKVNIGLAFPAVFFIVAYSISFLFAESSEEINRAIAYLSFFGLFVIAYFHGDQLYFSRFWLPVFSLVYACIAVTIFLTGNRTFINPNWIAVTLFFVFFLAMRESKMSFLFLGFCLSFFIFESRGTSVVFIVSILIHYSQVIFGNKFTKIGYLASYFIMVFVLFFIINDLSNEGQIANIINSFSSRGLGGRELALIPGYLDLVESVFLGKGPASSGGYSDLIAGRSVHIHFGLLELALKFSFLVIPIFFLLLCRVVRRSSIKEFPMVGGAMMVVFFYNGLAPSHLGINILLLIMISKVVNSAIYQKV